MMLQLRKAVLAEIVAALKLLVRCQHFSVGMAVAVSSHIRRHLGPALDWRHSDGRVYLEHAALLQLEPLQELLTFLWTHLSLKMQLLEPYIKAQHLLCTPVSQHLTALTLHLLLQSCILVGVDCLHTAAEDSPVRQLHVMQSLDTPLSTLEVHPDGTVQFSLRCLQELSTHSPSAQPSGSGQESDSRVLVSSA